jgi:IMP cyclohydrolase
MGRSVNSRNRVFEKTEDGFRTKAFDPALLSDPSLVIYNPLRQFDGRLILSNGDQTDTIRDFLSLGRDFRSALLTREFEPDAPNYTPRISAIIELDGTYVMSILKTAIPRNPNCCLRSFFEYSNSIPGFGHFISTYETDGDPLPSFTGEPIPIFVPKYSSLDDFANLIWNALNIDNKVSLYVRETVIVTGEVSDIIINLNV